MFGAKIEIMNNVYPAFADCSPTSRPSGDIMWFVSRRLGLGLRRWEQAAPAPRGAFPIALLYAFPNSASQATPAKTAGAGPGLRTWFDKAGILICRPAEGSKCRLAVALKGGHNGEHHNHNDVGSYVAVVGAEALCVDIGSETYTARTFSKQRYVSNALNSYGHPVPVVAGQLQRVGRAARGEVVKTEFTDDADTFVLDLRKAYGVTIVKKLERTFVYSRAGEGSLTVTDKVEFSEPQTFGTAVMTFGQWRKLDEKSFLLFDLEETARVDVEASAEFELKREEIKEDTKRQAYRIGIDLKEPVDKATIRVTITPATLGDAGGGQLLRNGSFELGAWGWSLADRGMSTLSTEQASDGKQSLKIVDPGKDRGSSASSARMRIDQPGEYELRGKYFGEKGSGVGLYMKYYDTNMRVLNKTDPRGWISGIGSVGKSIGEWSPFAFRFTPPGGTVFLRVWIHSGNGATVTGYLDELAVAPVK